MLLVAVGIAVAVVVVIAIVGAVVVLVRRTSIKLGTSTGPSTFTNYEPVMNGGIED